MMDNTKKIIQRKPKTIVEKLKEKNLYGLFAKLEVKHLENIINEAKNAIPKVKEIEANDKAKKLKEAQQKLVNDAKKLDINVELFAKLSGATETHKVSS